MSFIKLTAFGTLTREPEIKNAGAENSVCGFAIASNRKVKGEEKATFLDCKAFGKTADNIAKFFGKGRRIIIDGELEEQRWEDKQTGAQRSKLVCLVRSFDFPEKAEPREDDHGERAARENFRKESPTPAPRSDRDKRETRSGEKQMTMPEARPLESYGEEDAPF